MSAKPCMRKPSIKFLIVYLNINWRFLILDLQKLERMFKPNTSAKLMLALLAVIMVARGQLIKRDTNIDEMTSKLVTVTTGEPVLRTQTIQTKQTIIQGKGHHHDHSNIVFDGPEEEIVMRINLQFDKELKHFRIQQMNYENEDAQDEVVIQDVTQLKKTSQNVNHISNVVTTTKNVNQNIQESSVQQDESLKPFISKILLNVNPKISVESQKEGKTYISSKKAEERPIITAAIKADDQEKNANNKWVRLFNVNHDKIEKESSKQNSSEDKAHKISAELPIFTKAKELLAKKTSLSRHQDKKNSQQKESETEVQSAQTNTQGSTSNPGSGSTPVEQTPLASSEGSTTPAEQTPPINTDGSAPVEQTPPAPTESTPVAPVEQVVPVKTLGGSLQAEQTLTANNAEGSSAPVQQSPHHASNQNESGSVPATQDLQGQAQPEEAGFLSLFN